MIGTREIDGMVGQWRERMTPVSPEMRRAHLNDPWHHTMLEMMRRFAHIYDRAMELEDVPEETRQRVLSMVLLGSPDGLESLAYKRAEQLYEEAILSSPPRPVYFNPYNKPFHPDEPFKMGEH